MTMLTIILMVNIGIVAAHIGNDPEELQFMKELSERVKHLETCERMNVEEDVRKEKIYNNRLADMEAELAELRKTIEEKDKKILDVRRRRDDRWLRQAENESPIAFTASLGNHFQHAGINQAFRFENVITNVGGAYDKFTGVFKAPLAGVYVFSTTVVAMNEIHAHAALFKNDQQLNIMYVGSRVGNADTSSATITLELQTGDDISVRAIQNDGTAFYGDNHNLFTGFLLQQTYGNVPSVIGK
ncbi:hypothetical protein ACF0H5_014951 [Mactra antiquata]